MQLPHSQTTLASAATPILQYSKTPQQHPNTLQHPKLSCILKLQQPQNSLAPEDCSAPTLLCCFLACFPLSTALGGLFQTCGHILGLSAASLGRLDLPGRVGPQHLHDLLQAKTHCNRLARHLLQPCHGDPCSEGMVQQCKPCPSLLWGGGSGAVKWSVPYCVYDCKYI